MSEKIKPVRCGCGGEAKALSYMINRWYVKCRKCSVGQMFAYRSEAEAVTAWNTAMGTNTRRLLEVLVHDATDTNVGDKFDKDTNVLCKERTAKVMNDGINYCENCEGYVEVPMAYCPYCGARLEWE